MMFLLSLVLIGLLANVIDAKTLMCDPKSSSSPANYYCLAVDNSTPVACQQCAAGVKYFCRTNPTLSTSSWKKGVNVLENCKSISQYTAIATFNGEKYSGHAAVFYSCDSKLKTITVYDQWEGHKWSSRILSNTAGSASNNPTKFFVITV